MEGSKEEKEKKTERKKDQDYIYRNTKITV